MRCLYLVGGKEGARFSGCGLPTYSCEVIVRRGNGAVACVETRGCGYSDEIAASMGLGAFGLIAVVGYVGSLFKDEGGVPVPSVLTNVTSSRIQLYEYLVYDKPSPWRAVVKENYLLWFTLYSVAHLLMYVEPQRNLFRPWKLNKKYPEAKLILREIFRSAMGVMIGSLYEIGLYYLISEKIIPRHFVPNFLQVNDQGTLTFSTLLASGTIAYLWGDA